MAQLSLFEDSRRRRPWLPADEDHVVAVAGDVVDELALVPPVDAEMVLSYLGVRKVVREAMPWSGCLFDDNGALTVKVRLADSWPRQRFSMLHEGGHTFLPGFNRMPQFRCNPGQLTTPSQHTIEALSDIAASELLFPRRQFSADLGLRPTMDLVEDLADSYEASITATAIRVASLSPFDTCLVVLTMSVKPSQRTLVGAEPALRVRWSRGRGDWPFIPQHKSASPTGPLARAFGGDQVDEWTSLADLCRCDARVYVSARRYTHYTDDEGPTSRVLAMYSRSWSRIRAHNG